MAILDAKSSKVTALGNTYLFGSTIKESVAKSALATFADGGDKYPMLSLTGYINPVQTGSGDPSPSNVRPITGWTGMNVTRTGELYVTKNTPLTYGYITGTGAGNGTHTNGEKVTDYIPISGGKTVTLAYSFPSITTGGLWACIATYDSNKTFLVRHTQSSDPAASDSYTVELEASTAYIRVSFRTYDLEIKSLYVCETSTKMVYPISWADEAGTVYGGTLDVTQGKLVVTHRAANLSESYTVSNLTAYNSGNKHGVAFNNALPAKATYLDGLCNVAPVVSGSSSLDHFMWFGVNTRYIYWVGILDVLGLADLSAFATWMESNDVIVYIPYATPQEFDIDPESISTILGQNNIWADTGDVEVSYVADTKLYIDKVIAAL